MKCLIAATVLAVTLAVSGPVFAETIVPSKVDAVDLHPGSAEITRLAHCNLPAGETSLVIKGLPAHLVSQSLRVVGFEAGVSIRSVSIRSEEKGENPASSSEEEALLDEQQDLIGRLDALEAKESMIRKVAEAQPNVAIGTTGSGSAPEFWSSIWTKVAEGLEDTKHRRRDTKKRLQIVTKRLNEVRASTTSEKLLRQTFTVALDVTADHATETDIKLVYRVSGASWQSLYDARLQTSSRPARLELMRRANVSQSTGEDWTDVALTLSTSELSETTMAASLAETSDVTGNSRNGVTRLGLPPGPESARYDFAKSLHPYALSIKSYDATQQIEERVSIASGAKPRLFKIGALVTDVDVSVRSVPIADKHAYFQAKFECKERIPLTSGEMELYRDGTFVGRAVFAGAALGEQVTIGFGIDDLVSVERSDVVRKERNTTVKLGTASVERLFKTVVKNRHPFPVRIEIVDREPAFNNTAIVLNELPSTTPPTERQIDGHRGVLAWSHDYAPGEVRTVNLGWQVRWPAKLGPPKGDDATTIFRFEGGATF